MLTLYYFHHLHHRWCWPLSRNNTLPTNMPCFPGRQNASSVNWNTACAPRCSAYALLLRWSNQSEKVFQWRGEFPTLSPIKAQMCWAWLGTRYKDCPSRTPPIPCRRGRKARWGPRPLPTQSVPALCLCHLLCLPLWPQTLFSSLETWARQPRLGHTASRLCFGCNKDCKSQLTHEPALIVLIQNHNIDSASGIQEMEA